MRSYLLFITMLSALVLQSCSSDNDESDRWLTFGLPWAKTSTTTSEQPYIRSYDIAIGDTATTWMAVVISPTNANVAIPELHLSTSQNDIIKYTPIWKNPGGHVYHSLVTANKEGTTYLYFEYKDLKDSIRINVLPK